MCVEQFALHAYYLRNLSSLLLIQLLNVGAAFRNIISLNILKSTNPATSMTPINTNGIFLKQSTHTTLDSKPGQASPCAA